MFERQLFSEFNWIYIHLVFQVLTILWATHFYNLVSSLFIPIAGRVGSLVNPEIRIGLITSGFTLFTTSFLVRNLFI